LGVDLFFVLSGFLITTLLLQEWGEHGAVSFRGFYSRRALRLLPALGVYIFVAMLLTIGGAASGALDMHHLRVALQGMGSAVLYVSNFAKAFGLDLGPFTHMWSLAEEEQFYFIWPFVLVVCLRRGIDPRRIAKTLFAIVVVLSLVRVGGAAAGISNEQLISNPALRSDPILIGCAAGIAQRYGFFSWGSLAIASRRWLTVGSVVAAAAAAEVANRWPYWGHAAGLPLFEVAAMVVIAAAAFDGDLWAARALRFPPLVWTRKISYSLYIWGGLFLAAQPRSAWAAALAVALSFGAAALSRYLVEQPFLDRRKRLPQLGEPEASGLALATS